MWTGDCFYSEPVRVSGAVTISGLFIKATVLNAKGERLDKLFYTGRKIKAQAMQMARSWVQHAAGAVMGQCQQHPLTAFEYPEEWWRT